MVRGRVGRFVLLPPAAYSASTYYPISMWVADFNGDHKPDMVVAGVNNFGASSDSWFSKASPRRGSADGF
jgi:hypothetical protein